MTCLKCKKDFETFRGYCNNCFPELLERRAKKELSDSGWPKKGDKILVLDDGTIVSSVSLYILKGLLKGFPAEIVSEGDHDIKIIPWTADQEIEEFFKKIMEKEESPKNSDVKLLRKALYEEVEHYAEIKNIAGDRRVKTQVQELVDKLEKRYPGTKFATLKASEEEF